MFTNDGKQAFIICDSKLSSPWVIGRSGTKWYSRVSNDTIYIKVSPTYKVEEEIDSVYVMFYLSKGATISPDPSQYVDLTVKDGVKYTVTSEDGKAHRTYVVTHSSTDHMPYGEGATLGKTVAEKLFTDLGYPGEANNWGFTDSRLYGDLNGYVSFCGHDHVVLLARQYSDPHFDSGPQDPDFDLGFRVYNASDLSYACQLNCGNLDRQMIRAISSDWNGVMVATVVSRDGKSSELYYWERPTDTPKLLYKADVNLASSGDGSNYIHISGDIKGQANITCGGVRGASGDHYLIHLEGGVPEGVQTISTGYASDDCGGFQNIAMLSSEPKSSYVVADSEGGAATPGSSKAYVNTFSGKTKVVLFKNILQSMGNGGFHDWWVGTGGSLNRPGSRRPYVASIPINGKPYVMFLNGTVWWWCNTLIDPDDLKTRIPGAEIDFSVNAGWSFGASGDLYYDEASHEAYWVYYADRYGMFMQRITCFE